MFTNFGVRPGASPEADAEVARWGFCFFPRSLMNFAADMSATKYGYLPPLNSVAWYTKFGIANRYTVTNAGIALIGVYASQIEYPRDYGVYAGSAGRLQLQRHRYLDQGQAYSQGRRKHSAPPTDKTYVNQKKAGAILEPLFAEQPEHPGVAHYFIHAYDYPPLADRGLDAARRYAQIAQDSPHALHVPSHIFTRLGLWLESIDSNLASAASAPKKNNAPGNRLHAKDYLIYAHLQGAHDGSAGRRLTNFTSDRIRNFRFSPNGKTLAVTRFDGVSDVVLLPDTCTAAQ